MEVDRIGILGGTFNPIHMGHLIIAQDAMELFNLSQVVFVPCASPPHKEAPALAPADHRIAMINAAIEGELFFSVSDIEVDRGGKSFAVDTVRELTDMYPANELDFIIGSDSLAELHMWKDVDKLQALCDFKVMERPGFSIDEITSENLKLPHAQAEHLQENCASGHLIDISSTNIRYRIAEGMSIRYLVHPATEMYISEHSLYL